MGFSKSVSSKENNTKLCAPDEKLKNCGSALATVVAITIYKQKMGVKPLALHHHYLLIQVSGVNGKDSFGENINLSERWILAEKGRASTGEVQYEVRVKIIDSDEADKKRSKDHVKYSVDLRSANEQDSIKIPTDKLVRILNGTDTTYTLTRFNCWKYADGTMRKLIKEFLALPYISGNMQGQLREAAAKIPTLLLPDDATPFLNVALGLGVVGPLLIGFGRLILKMARLGVFGIEQAVLAHIFTYARKFIGEMLKSAKTENFALNGLIRLACRLCEKDGISRSVGGCVVVLIVVFGVMALYKAIRSVYGDFENFKQVKNDVLEWVDKNCRKLGTFVRHI